MDLDINFAQRLAEDTKFPDNYFDIVVVHLLFHEVSAAAAKNIYPEIHRVLRKGGVWSGDGAGGWRETPRHNRFQSGSVGQPSVQQRSLAVGVGWP